MPLVGIRAYARHRGVSHTTVLKAIASGRVTAKGGKLDPKVADRQWAASTNQSKPRNTVSGNPDGNGRWGNQHGRGGQEEKPAPEAPAEQPGAGSYAQARAGREAYLARLAKIEYEKAIGKLIDADEVRKKWFESGRRVRESVMSVCDRVAPLVTGLSDVAEVHRIIENELRVALEGLSRE
jgi:hypothetical protein